MSETKQALIGQLLDLVESGHAHRPDFAPAISREKAKAILSRVLDIYDCRDASTASIYALVALDDEIGFKPVPLEPHPNR